MMRRLLLAVVLAAAFTAGVLVAPAALADPPPNGTPDEVCAAAAAGAVADPITKACNAERAAATGAPPTSTATPAAPTPILASAEPQPAGPSLPETACLAASVAGAVAAPVAAACNAGDVAAAAGQVVDFVTNPLGYLAAAVTGAAVWVLGQVALFANASTAPDLSTDWWVSAYTKGMAIGSVLLGFVLLYEIVQVARRKVSGDDLIEAMAMWVPAWFAGVIFGPALAQFVVEGATYLADGIINSMTGFGGGDAFKAVSDAAANAGIGGGATGAGQAFMALIVGLGVLIASVLVYVSLCIQSVIIYLATAVFAVGWVWIVTQRHRDTAWRIPRMVIGLLFSKALLFFLLGVTMAIATAATAIQGDGISKDFALAIMAIIGMLLAAFAPLLLLKHAPVIPGTTGATLTAASGAAAGAGAGKAARGAMAAKGGMARLSAIADRNRKNPSAVLGAGPKAPPGAAPSGSGGPPRAIDGPVSATSKAGKRGSAATSSGTGTPRPPSPSSNGGSSGGAGSSSRWRRNGAAPRSGARRNGSANRNGARNGSTGASPAAPAGGGNGEPSTNGTHGFVGPTTADWGAARATPASSGTGPGNPRPGRPNPYTTAAAAPAPPSIDEMLAARRAREQGPRTPPQPSPREPRLGRPNPYNGAV